MLQSEERIRDRSIREEQDLAYLESLREDQEKARKAHEEEQRIREEEERQKEEERKRIEEEEYANNKRSRELDRKRRELPSEPEDGVNIVIRLPDGSRLSRRFNVSDKIKASLLSALFPLPSPSLPTHPFSVEVVQPFLFVSDSILFFNRVCMILLISMNRRIWKWTATSW